MEKGGRRTENEVLPVGRLKVMISIGMVATGPTNS